MVSMVFVAAAIGHTARFSSTVTVKFDKKTAIFDGAVASDKRGCVTNRTVTLRLRAADGSTSVVSTGTTDAAGAWQIQATNPPASGTYFAEAEKKILRKNSKHRHICAPAASKDVTVK
jgi:hypothetical protein